jgi:hypothetical protein
MNGGRRKQGRKGVKKLAWIAKDNRWTPISISAVL